MENKITNLFNIKYPIIQGGMIWNSSWKLASAVSNSGGLGIIGSGSMNPDILKYHIRECRKATSLPFGVNVPLLYSHTEENLKVIINEGVKIVFTSAGNPKEHTKNLKDNDIKVVHVVSSKKFAMKSQDAGVDAVVAEGFEAGGHNGREETTTMCLIPDVARAINLPLIAAGGIGSGASMFAAMSLGADGVQMGSRFVTSEEGSGHLDFKQCVVNANEGATKLALKKLVPVRMMKNELFQDIKEAEDQGATENELRNILGKGKAKMGMYEGKLKEGELEIGQVSALIDDIKPVSKIIEKIIVEYNHILKEMADKKL